MRSVALVVALLCCIFGSRVLATENQAGKKSLDITIINSDYVKYESDTIKCTGSVILSFRDKVISADTVSYNKESNVINASGSVVVKDSHQNTYFADEIQTDTSFNKGYAKNIKIIFADKSRFAANKAIIKNGKLELLNAVYTACYECAIPTWKIISSKVVYDPESDVQYDSSSIEFFGALALNVHSMSHVSPKIARKSGVLPPKLSTSQSAGVAISIPYFIDMSSSQNLTVKPIITSKIGSVMWAEYNQRFRNGECNIDASITDTASMKSSQLADNLSDKEKKAVKKIQKSGYRGHIFSTAVYEIDDKLRASSDINLISDSYYLKKYPFLKQCDRTLTSNVMLEEFDNRNYASVRAMMFQNVRTDTNPPRIFPMLEKNMSFADCLCGTLDSDLCAINFDFNDARKSQKYMANTSWYRKILTSYGGIIDLKVSFLLTALSVSEKEKTKYDSFCAAIPQVNCSYMLPMEVRFTNANQYTAVFTPIAGMIMSTNKQHKDLYEDLFYEINDINFSNGNRSMSVYNLDEGKRFFYGVKQSLYYEGGNIANITVAQSIELVDSKHNPKQSGMFYRHSNILLSGDAALNDEITIFSNGSYSMQKKNWTRIECGITYDNSQIGCDIIAFNGNQFSSMTSVPVTAAANDFYEKFKGVEFMGYKHLSKKWRADIGFALGDQSCKIIKHSFGLLYKDECAEFKLSVERSDYRAGDLKPDTSIKFIIHLKNLGI